MGGRRKSFSRPSRSPRRKARAVPPQVRHAFRQSPSTRGERAAPALTILRLTRTLARNYRRLAEKGRRSLFCSRKAMARRCRIARGVRASVTHAGRAFMKSPLKARPCPKRSIGW
jgi:hypothetical protein